MNPELTAGLEILSKLLTLAASPGGLELLARIIGPSQEKIDAAVAGLKDAPPPKGSE
jgi:hypothetical protein